MKFPSLFNFYITYIAILFISTVLAAKNMNIMKHNMKKFER